MMDAVDPNVQDKRSGFVGIEACGAAYQLLVNREGSVLRRLLEAATALRSQLSYH
jgi:hypothetical protein